MKSTITSIFAFFIGAFPNESIAQCPAGQTPIDITITTASFAPFIYWYIAGPANDTIARGGEQGVYMNGQVYNSTACAQIGVQYTFYAYHAWGDVWNGGTYTVYDGATVVINNNGNSPDNFITVPNDLEVSETFTIQGLPTSAPQFDSSGPFSAYPNPVSDRLYVRFPDTGSDHVYNVYDSSGRVMATGTLSADAEQYVDVSMLRQGICFLRMMDTSGSVFTARILKN